MGSNLSSEEISSKLFITSHKSMKLSTGKILIQYSGVFDMFLNFYHFAQNNFYDSQKTLHYDSHFKEGYRSWHRNARRGKTQYSSYISDLSFQNQLR